MAGRMPVTRPVSRTCPPPPAPSPCTYAPTLSARPSLESFLKALVRSPSNDRAGLAERLRELVGQSSVGAMAGQRIGSECEAGGRASSSQSSSVQFTECQHKVPRNGSYLQHQGLHYYGVTLAKVQPGRGKVARRALCAPPARRGAPRRPPACGARGKARSQR